MYLLLQSELQEKLKVHEFKIIFCQTIYEKKIMHNLLNATLERKAKH
jgi:hypothetical protein